MARRSDSAATRRAEGSEAMTQQLALALTPAQARDAALGALEQARRGYVARVRAVAEGVALERGYVTADDLHRLCPPPTGMDGRGVGAGLRRPDFRAPGRGLRERGGA